jgi:hypothetical protein
MANAWKADLTVAKLALSADVGRTAAQLAGWSGARLGQDTIWWKAPKTKPVAHHQDSSFMDFLDPAETVTCWVTLDDTHRDAGTLEYVPGSHLWPLTPLPEAFHGQDDYRAQMKAAAAAAGVEPPPPIFIEVPAKSGTAPVPTRRVTACDARSAFTWSRMMRNLAIGPAAISIAATSVPVIHRSTKAFSPSCGQVRGIGQSGSSTIAKAVDAFRCKTQDRRTPTSGSNWRILPRSLQMSNTAVQWKTTPVSAIRQPLVTDEAWAVVAPLLPAWAMRE